MKLNCPSCIKGHCDQCIDIDCLCRESHDVVSLRKEFTQVFNDVMPNSIDELKRLLKSDVEFDVDKEKTIDSDRNEFAGNMKSGFDVYEERNNEQHFAKDFVSDVMLPAHVYDGKASCGKWKIKGCLETDLHEHGNGYIRKTTMRCNSKACKICASSAIKREAQAITNRMMTFANLKQNRKIYLKQNRARILHHDIVSIPHDEHSLYLTKDGRKKLRTKALKILKQFDIDGGVMIDHPYRFSKGLESARLSPHLHFILTGWLDGQLVKEVYEQTGWIITNVSTLESRKDCYNLAKYLLSHSAVFLKDEGKRSTEHSVRYFGECHNKKFKVTDALEFSVTGKEQIDNAILGRDFIEKKKDGESKFIPLQRVCYTHSVIYDSIKDTENEYFEFTGSLFDLGKTLRDYIRPLSATPQDNPAIPQSDTLIDDAQPMKFLQMRFDYGDSQFSIVQSVYVNIVFDPSLDELCPECSLKMQTLAPPESSWSEQQQQKIASLLVDLPLDTTLPFDDVADFDYLRNVGISVLGMPYFDENGMLQNDTGVYQRPQRLDMLNPVLYWKIIKNIDVQSAKYQFKVQHGRAPNPDELKEVIDFIKSQKPKNHSLLQFA